MKTLCDRRCFRETGPEWILRADEAGLLMLPGESEAAFRERLRVMEKELAALDSETAALPSVPAAVRERAQQIVAKLYGIVPEWAAALYSTGETGHFSAGVTGLTDNRTPVIFLSGALERKARHRGYTAEETLAHEMVHAARSAFPDSVYEEYFPCQVHASRFRRTAGNFFRSWHVPVLFFGGLCAAVLHPAAVVLPLFLLLREMQLRRRIRRAAETLRGAGLKPEPVLLRLSDREIQRLSGGALPDFMLDGASVRREVLYRRFSR